MSAWDYAIIVVWTAPWWALTFWLFGIHMGWWDV